MLQRDLAVASMYVCPSPAAKASKLMNLGSCGFHQVAERVAVIPYRSQGVLILTVTVEISAWKTPRNHASVPSLWGDDT